MKYLTGFTLVLFVFSMAVLWKSYTFVKAREAAGAVYETKLEQKLRYHSEAAYFKRYVSSQGFNVNEIVIRETLKSIDYLLPKYFPNGPFTRQDILALVLFESSFRQHVVGTSGEKGLFQVMPNEFIYYKVKGDHFNIFLNTDIGLRVLKRKYDKHQEYKKAVIAYNGLVKTKKGQWCERYWNGFLKRLEITKKMSTTPSDPVISYFSRGSMQCTNAL